MFLSLLTPENRSKISLPEPRVARCVFCQASDSPLSLALRVSLLTGFLRRFFKIDVFETFFLKCKDRNFPGGSQVSALWGQGLKLMQEGFLEERLRAMLLPAEWVGTVSSK